MLYAMVEEQDATIAALTEAIENYGALEATVNTVDAQLTGISMCLGGSEPEEPETPEEPEEPETPEETYMMVSSGLVCTNDERRTFKTREYTTAEECSAACTGDCMYFSFRESNMDCIGCMDEPSVSNQHTGEYVTYEMTTGRRQLSELEQLREENLALKAALERARRN